MALHALDPRQDAVQPRALIAAVDEALHAPDVFPLQAVAHVGVCGGLSRCWTLPAGACRRPAALLSALPGGPLCVQAFSRLF